MPDKQKSNTNFCADQGFSLIECVCATVVFVFGTLAIANLAIYAIKMETFAFDSSRATSYAETKIEELRTTALTNGGGLNSNIAGYFDSPETDFDRRWEIADGPADTKRVSIVVVHKTDPSKIRTTRLDTLIR
jgi:hypothetical protein